MSADPTEQTEMLKIGQSIECAIKQHPTWASIHARLVPHLAIFGTVKEIENNSNVIANHKPYEDKIASAAEMLAHTVMTFQLQTSTEANLKVNLIKWGNYYKNTLKVPELKGLLKSKVAEFGGVVAAAGAEVSPSQSTTVLVVPSIAAGSSSHDGPAEPVVKKARFGKKATDAVAK